MIEKYNYKFPEELIAQKPASPRDSARLLIYNRKSGKIQYDIFANIADYLPKNSVLVFNKTKVLPARLILFKSTGGKVKVIYLETLPAGRQASENLIKVMADRKIAVDSDLKLSSKIHFKVVRQDEKFYFLKPSFPLSKLFGILEKYGVTPIPPYIKNSPLGEKELREKYQTVFASDKGSVAAPTASLHFTKRLMKKMKKSGIGIRFITLHVNLGTFAPLTEENLKSGRLHEEYYEISKKDAEFLNRSKKSGRKIVAVGTTAVRALESASDDSGKLKYISGKTDIFIREGYKFKFVDSTVTNFHVPKSSLLMLVSAFIGRKKLFVIYNNAIKRRFKLFSFGDGMLIL